MEANPLKLTRTNLNLTLQNLADISGLGYQTVLRTEQGLYKEISPRLLLILRHRGVDTKTLVQQYGEWRKEKRKNAGGKLIHYHLIIQVIPSKHPFQVWLELSGLSEIGFCKEFCVNRPIVHKFLKQPYLCGSVPTEIIEALSEAGYSTEVLERDFEKFKAATRELAVS